MADLKPVNERGLTNEQEAILEEVYCYSDKAEYTEEDLALARQMFDTPEKFKLLRKILGIHTAEERGITFKSPTALVDANPNQLQEYAIAVAVSELSDERIRKALASLYVRLREVNREAKAEEFKKQNELEVKEAELSEEFEDKQEEEKRQVGENL